MRKLLLLFVIISVCGCQRAFQINEYKETKDEFKKVQRYSFEESLRPTERRPSVGSIRNFYLNEMTASGQSDISLYVILIKNQVDFYTEDTFYILTDKKLIRKEISQKETEHYTTLSESTSNVLTADSSTVSVIDSYSQHHYVQSRFRIEFTADEINALIESDKLIYRYYGGGKTSTFQTTSANLNDIKKVLSPK